MLHCYALPYFLPAISSLCLPPAMLMTIHVPNNLTRSLPLPPMLVIMYVTTHRHHPQ